MLARVRGVALFAIAVVPGGALAEPSTAQAPAAGAGAPTREAAGAVAPLPSHAASASASASASAAPATAPSAPAAPFTWQPFGYLRLQYLAVQNDPNVAFVGRDDGFELQNARLGVRGELADRAAFVVALDGAVDERLQVNTTQGKLRVGLRDAYADAPVGLGLVVRAGLFQALVDPEALVADTRRAFVDRPLESRGMRATEGYQTAGLPPGRSLGAAIRIEPRSPDRGVALGFELAVQNGADEFASNNDNDKPAVSVAVLARLPHDTWVVAAGRYNPRTVNELPFRQDEDDLQGALGLRVELGPVALGGGLVVQRTTFPTVGSPAQRAFGGHAEVLFALPIEAPIALGYRFGVLDPSSLISTDRVMEHTAGAVWALPRHHLRAQLQLTHVVEQGARALDNDRAQLAVELAL